MTKRISAASAILAGWAIALSVMLLALTPVAMAHHADDHDKGKGRNASQGQGQGNGGGGDHDGDADSDPNTSLEDSHEPEPDATPSDNQHPSGKDRSGEPGGSGNQGKAESNPDDSKGPKRFEGGLGDDKPQGPGGTDRDDQDGNNGCGNDDDFDDDNNGWCGKPDRDDVGSDVIDEPKPCDKDETMPGIQPCEDDDVEGGVIENPGFPDDRKPPTDLVLGGRLVNEAAPEVEADVLRAPSQEEGAVLPFTGAGIATIVLTGLALMTAGGILTRRRA